MGIKTLFVLIIILLISLIYTISAITNQPILLSEGNSLDKEQMYELKTEILDWNHKSLNNFLLGFSIIIALLILLTYVLGWKGIESLRKNIKSDLKDDMEDKIDIAIDGKLNVSNKNNEDKGSLKNNDALEKRTRRAFEND